MKRLLFVIGGILIIGAVVALGYFFRFRGGGAAPSGGETPSAGTGGLPEASGGPPPAGGAGAVQAPIPSGGKFSVASENPVRSYFVESASSIVVVEPNGTIAKISNGRAVTLNSTPIANLSEAAFSKDGRMVAVLFGSREGPQASVFDVASKSWQPLAENPTALAWSPATNDLAYVTKKNGATVIATVDAADKNAKPKTLLEVRGEDLALLWQRADELLIADRSSAFSQSVLLAYDIAKKTLTPVFTDRPGLLTAWDEDRSTGLLFVGNPSGRGGRLAIAGRDGSVLENLSFLTLPSKCAFGKTTRPAPGPKSGTSSAPAVQETRFLACAIPRDQSKLSISALPDDYEKRGFFTNDDFYKIDLTSGTVEELFVDPAKSIDADRPAIADGKLFFINRYDSRLYAISLR